MTSKGEIVSLKAGRNTFARIFMIGQKRSIDVPEMLSYCLGPCPLSLATAAGNICKTTKSKVFESEFPDCTIDADSVPANSTVLLEAVAVLQSTVAIPETYGELADNILARILAIARKFKASRLDFVADRYQQLSIKHAEREKLASHSASNVCIYGRDQVFKPWKKFISSGRNKENLVAFLLDCWSKMNGDFLEEIQLYVTSGR